MLNVYADNLRVEFVSAAVQRRADITQPGADGVCRGTVTDVQVD